MTQRSLSGSIGFTRISKATMGSFKLFSSSSNTLAGPLRERDFGSSISVEYKPCLNLLLRVDEGFTLRLAKLHPVHSE